MNMFEEAKSLAGTMKMRKISQNEMAKMLGTSQSYVANKLRLLQLDEELQIKIISSNLTERHARALLRLDPHERPTALKKICEQKLSVAESEALIDMLRTSEAPRLIGMADKLSCVDKFADAINKSSATLTSLGVKNYIKTSYQGSKRFITICIDENA